MFEVRKWIELDAGHRVPFHDSACRNLHGHRYRVTLTVGAEELVPPESGRSDSGMVLDFGVLKRILKDEVHDLYDHKLLLWEEDPLVKKEIGHEEGVVFLPCIPTAEELARFWGERIRERLEIWGPSLIFRSLEVRETPTSYATYYFSGKDS